MKKTTTIIAACLLLASASFSQTWSLDKAHSRVGFTVTHLGIADIGGTFGTIDAKITSAKPDFTDAVIELTADVNTIDTDNENRDKHLKSGDFFDTEKNPTFTFKSTSVKKVSDKKYKVTGDLTLHGVTKPVTLDATFNGTAQHPQSKKTVAGWNISGIVKRSDFGIATGMPAAMLADDVKLVASTEFIKE